MSSEPDTHIEASLQIEPLELRHLSEIDAIERRSYPMPWSRAMFVSEIVKPSSICLGAFLASRLIGYLVVSRYVDAWHLMNLAVDADHRRSGVATRLLEALLARTAGDEQRGYTLEVRPSNIAAAALYERLGFSQRGIRRGYYTDNREDALIMWRDSPGDHDH